MVTQEFLECVCNAAGEITTTEGCKHNINLSSPSQISKAEPLSFPELGGTVGQHDICMGVSFNELVNYSVESSSALVSELKKGQDQQYIITARFDKQDKLGVAVTFLSGYTDVQMAKAYFHGCILKRILTTKSRDIRVAKHAAEKSFECLWPMFEKALSDVGWRLDKTVLKL